MNLKLTFVLLCSVISFIGFGQTKLDCNKFKTGKFEIENQDGTISYIERTAKYQTEKTSDGSANMKDQIIWIDECTYRLVPVESKIKNRKMKKTIGETEMYFEFVEILEHAYIVRIVAPSLELVVEAKVYESGFLNYDK